MCARCVHPELLETCAAPPANACPIIALVDIVLDFQKVPAALEAISVVITLTAFLEYALHFLLLEVLVVKTKVAEKMPNVL